MLIGHATAFDSPHHVKPSWHARVVRMRGGCSSRTNAVEQRLPAGLRVDHPLNRPRHLSTQLVAARTAT